MLLKNSYSYNLIFIFILFYNYLKNKIYLKNIMFENLPWDIKREILLFDSRFILRNKNVVWINSIPRNDQRYLLLSKIPRMYSMSDNTWSVILSYSLTKRFVLGFHRSHFENSTTREFFFSTFNHCLENNTIRIQI